jgi:hypothetical protein
MSRSDAPVPAVAATRRRFAKALAALAGVPFLARALPLDAQAVPTPAPSPSPTPAPPSPFVEAMAEVMRARFGTHLAPGQIAEAKKALERITKNAERMKQVKLTNADEPDVVFFAAVPAVSGAR